MWGPLSRGGFPPAPAGAGLARLRRVALFSDPCGTSDASAAVPGLKRTRQPGAPGGTHIGTLKREADRADRALRRGALAHWLPRGRPRGSASAASKPCASSGQRWPRLASAACFSAVVGPPPISAMRSCRVLGSRRSIPVTVVTGGPGRANRDDRRKRPSFF